MKLSYNKPIVTLVGKDGNAFTILANVRQAMHRAGAKEEEIESFISEATAGDYDNLLSTCFKYVDVN